MAIQFNQIPSNLRVPFAYFEVNPGQAPYQSNARLLLIGQMLSTGTAIADEPVQITGGEDGLFGPNSMLSAMYKAARRAAPFREIWALPLAAAAGATYASATIDVEGAPTTTSGSAVIYIGDVRVTVPVSPSMTNYDIAQALMTAIRSQEARQVTVASTTAGVAATALVSLAGPATGNGTFALTVDTKTYTTAVTSGDSGATVAANLVTTINSTAGANVTAAAVGANVTLTAIDTGAAANAWAISNASTVLPPIVLGVFAGGVTQQLTITARNKGTLGNTIGIYTRLYPDDGPFADDLFTITAMSGGSGDPSITTALANLGDQEFDWIAMPYATAAYIAEMDTFLDARWGPMEQLYGHYVTVKNGTAGALQAFTSTLNGWHGSLLGVQNYPAPTYVVCAALAAIMCDHLQGVPELSRPLQTLSLPGLRGPKLSADRWTITQRQSFYYGGVSALRVERDGTLAIDRIVSMYQTDAWGSNDMTWLDVNTQAQVMYGLRFLKQKVVETYPRAALVDVNPNNIQGFATAEDIRNVIVHGYRELVASGVFENADLFEQQLVVERNANDPNRVDAYLPLDHVNQLRILAGNATSYLQYPAAV